MLKTILGMAIGAVATVAVEALAVWFFIIRRDR